MTQAELGAALSAALDDWHRDCWAADTEGFRKALAARGLVICEAGRRLPTRLTNSQVDSACLSYDHSFGLDRNPDGGPIQCGHTEESRARLRLTCRSWWHAIRKELDAYYAATPEEPK